MAQRNLKERLAHLEAQQEKISESAFSAAYGAIMEVLSQRLPRIPEVPNHYERGGITYTGKPKVPAVNTYTRIEQLGDRLDGGALTDSDKEVLAALDEQVSAELRIVGCSAAEFVAKQAQASRYFTATYG